MADTLIPGLIKKMQDLEKFVDDSKNDKKSITANIIKIQ